MRAGKETKINQHCLPSVRTPKKCPCWGGVDEEYLYERKRNASECRGIHEFLEILVQKLKNQVELVFCVNDIQQFDNIRVIKLLKPRDLPYGSTGYTHPLSQCPGGFF